MEFRILGVRSCPPVQESSQVPRSQSSNCSDGNRKPDVGLGGLCTYSSGHVYVKGTLNDGVDLFHWQASVTLEVDKHTVATWPDVRLRCRAAVFGRVGQSRFTGGAWLACCVQWFEEIYGH